MPYGATVTLVTRTVTGRDIYGNDTFTDTTQDVAGVPVWPAGTGTEAMQGQDILSTTLTALLPTGTVVSASARAIIGGRTYEVTGNAYPWESQLTGTAPGVQVNLKAVTG